MILGSEAARGQTCLDDGVLGRVWEKWLLRLPLSCCVLVEGLQEVLTPHRHRFDAASSWRGDFGSRVGSGWWCLAALTTHSCPSRSGPGQGMFATWCLGGLVTTLRLCESLKVLMPTSW